MSNNGLDHIFRQRYLFPLSGKYFKTLSCNMLTVLNYMIHKERESINKLEQPNLFNGVEWNGIYVILTKRR